MDADSREGFRKADADCKHMEVMEALQDLKQHATDNRKRAVEEHNDMEKLCSRTLNKVQGLLSNVARTHSLLTFVGDAVDAEAASAGKERDAMSRWRRLKATSVEDDCDEESGGGGGGGGEECTAPAESAKRVPSTTDSSPPSRRQSRQFDFAFACLLVMLCMFLAVLMFQLGCPKYVAAAAPNYDHLEPETTQPDFAAEMDPAAAPDDDDHTTVPVTLSDEPSSSTFRDEVYGAPPSEYTTPRSEEPAGCRFHADAERAFLYQEFFNVSGNSSFVVCPEWRSEMESVTAKPLQQIVGWLHALEKELDLGKSIDVKLAELKTLSADLSTRIEFGCYAIFIGLSCMLVSEIITVCYAVAKAEAIPVIWFQTCLRLLGWGDEEVMAFKDTVKKQASIVRNRRRTDDEYHEVDEGIPMRRANSRPMCGSRASVDFVDAV